MSNPVTPDAIKKVADAVNEAADSTQVDALVAQVKPKLSAKVRGVIYEIGKWAGAIGAAGTFIAGTLEGAPSLYAATGSLALLSISNFIAKKHLAD